ncbi:toll-interacting protein A [Neodiprion pinetum]|uniref:Toll-interacting protein A n=1 Tax=Neodiprion lecontei TaxID=441921 RepID=A0A6J0BYT0_NEOLC|nr:toll-interacting protein A [Neodiprion lecontei]XP_046432864.1 toll-interacting protein A-like [Neodiprion fabricii]XP_046486657.1 toll-interacting protein A-like [Neodiprion pinetum]XP_046626336.1 toll-interacting protein A-like [Neodiprion virginianus]
MASVQRNELYDDWKKRAFLGPLPHGFLRVEESPRQQQEAADQQAALALQHHLQSAPPVVAARMGRLSVTITQAKLVKNYGMTRMDPYVRLRVGHSIYETHTDPNGGKNPHWNKVLQCYLPPGVTQIYVEIYDECSFMMDELIAWGHIEIPPQVILAGETHEDWYPLSGKQGDNQEGMINMVFSYLPTPGNPYIGQTPVMMVPSTNLCGMTQYAPVNVYTTPPAVAAVPTVDPSQRANAEIELRQIAEMFPNVDTEVIKSVYDANQGKKDVTINSLLQMCE